MMDQMNFSGSRLAMAIDQHVGERIRERRTMLGFTQEQLADALQISYQQIQKYETGANRVSAGRLYQIAKRLDVDVSTFFEGAGRFEPADANGSNGSNRTIIDLVRHFQTIEDPAVRQQIVSLVKTLANGAAANGTDDTGANANGASLDADNDVVEAPNLTNGARNGSAQDVRQTSSVSE